MKLAVLGMSFITGLSFSFSTFAELQNEVCETALQGDSVVQISVNPHLTVVMTTTEIQKLIRDYRVTGGRSYWRESKIRKGYAQEGEIVKHERDGRAMTNMGDILRALHSVLPEELREQIEVAIEDYGQFEILPH